jgi:MFS family permease
VDGDISHLHFRVLKHALPIAGIASSGAGFGAFAFSPMMTALIEHYGWRGAMLIFAGVFCHGLILASFIRPIPILKLMNTPNSTLNGADVDSKAEIRNDAANKGKSACNELSKACSQNDPKEEFTCSLTDIDSQQKSQNQTGQGVSILSTLLTSLKYTFDFKLLFVNVVVVLFLLINICMSIIHYSIFTFTPPYCESVGINTYQSSIVLSMIGLGDVLGRILGGLLGFKIDNTVVYMMAALWTGASLITYSFHLSVYGMMAVALSCGVGIGM